MLDTATPDRIRREAMRLFVAHGIDAVSLRDIADAAGIKAPSLYAHFRSRDDLIASMFQTGYAAYGRRLAEAAATPGPFRQRLEAMVRLICRLHQEDTLLFNFLLLTQHDTLRDLPVAAADNPVEIICQQIVQAMQARQIPAGDPALIAAALIGIIVQPATFHLYGRLSGGLAIHADAIVDIALRVVAPTPATPPPKPARPRPARRRPGSAGGSPRQATGS